MQASRSISKSVGSGLKNLFWRTSSVLAASYARSNRRAAWDLHFVRFGGFPHCSWQQLSPPAPLGPLSNTRSK